MIHLLLDKGIQIDHKSGWNCTALSHCLNSSTSEDQILRTIELLLQRGAQEGLNDVFCWAAEKGNENLVKHLLEKYHIDINVTDQYGETALFGIARAGHLHMMQLLIDKGIDVDYKSTFFSKEFTVLHGYLFGFRVSESKKLEVANLLVPHSATKNLDEVFVWAAQEGHETLVKYILYDKKIDINITNEQGETALFGAAYAPNIAMVKFLLQAGGDLLKKNHANQTPFEILPKHLRKEIALFKIRIDHHIPDDIRNDLLDIFLKQFHTKIKNTAAEKNRIDNIKLFLTSTLSPTTPKEIKNHPISLIQFFIRSLDVIEKIGDFSKLPQHMLDTIILLAAQNLIKEEYNIELSLSDVRKLRLLPSYFREPEASSSLGPHPK